MPVSRWPDRTPIVDSHDAVRMGRQALRTRLVRAVLVAAAVLLLAGAAAAARGADSATSRRAPIGPGVVVIDLSLSIGPRDYETIRATLKRLVAGGGSLGLVMFSDLPYEMLPPGTPVSELEPLLRMLAPAKTTEGQPDVPRTPWVQSFSAGTRISAALDLAAEMLRRDGIRHGSVLLLSDLVTAAEDVPALARSLQGLRDASVTVRVVPLAPLPDGLALFRGLLGKDALIPAESVSRTPPLGRARPAGVPVALLLLGVLVLVTLAAHERFAARLGLPQPRESSA